MGSDEQFSGRLAIPAIGPNGVYSLRYRHLGPADPAIPKYLGFEGVGIRLFNLRALHEATDEIHICEGEIDTMTLEMCGLHAVGVPGVNTWKKHHHRMFAGFTRVFVWADGDGPGREFAKRVAADLSFASVVTMETDGADVNSEYVAGGQERIVELLKEARQ